MTEDWVRVESSFGDWLEQWECEQPEVGARFVVLEDERQDTDPPRRIVHKVRLLGASPS